MRSSASCIPRRTQLSRRSRNSRRTCSQCELATWHASARQLGMTTAKGACQKASPSSPLATKPIRPGICVALLNGPALRPRAWTTYDFSICFVPASVFNAICGPWFDRSQGFASGQGLRCRILPHHPMVLTRRLRGVPATARSAAAMAKSPCSSSSETESDFSSMPDPMPASVATVVEATVTTVATEAATATATATASLSAATTQHGQCPRRNTRRRSP
ncbi:hypothetical protein PG993_013665, partial [Apiospora rasikravindrae]